MKSTQIDEEIADLIKLRRQWYHEKETNRWGNAKSAGFQISRINLKLAKLRKTKALERKKGVFIIDREEHGNGGLSGFQVLDRMPLKEALKINPMRKYSIQRKLFGFTPILSYQNNIDSILYYWDEEENIWRKGN